jgi:hypothetical protein
VTTIKALEHNQPAPAKAGVIKTADWIIDLGPEGGVKGGDLVATGTPEPVACHERSFTGQYLRPSLQRISGVEPILSKIRLQPNARRGAGDGREVATELYVGVCGAAIGAGAENEAVAAE